jgi:hypothetical protein
MPQFSRKQIETIVAVERLELNQERMKLRQQMLPLQRRIGQIGDRLRTLDECEGLIEGIEGKINV